MKVAQIKLLLAIAMILLIANSAFAGTIVSSAAPSGPGLGFAQVPVIATPNPNNDNVAAVDNNVVVPFKRFDAANYIDIVFTVNASDGVTEYAVSEFVDNNTGFPWTSYQMQLGFGTGAGFTLSAANDGLDFDTPDNDPLPTSGAFSAVGRPNEDTLVFSTGAHAAGAQPYNFRIDVPDLISRQTPSFTLREFPSTLIPEPSTLVLASVAALGLLMRRRGD